MVIAINHTIGFEVDDVSAEPNFRNPRSFWILTLIALTMASNKIPVILTIQFILNELTTNTAASTTASGDIAIDKVSRVSIIFGSFLLRIASTNANNSLANGIPVSFSFLSSTTALASKQ